jgi:ATP-dependent DNA ligase
MDLPTLYTKDKNDKIRQWTVSVTEHTGHVYIHKRYGQVGGKITETSTEIKKGKNIGKINETTPFTQAHSEAKSLWNKQKDQGYIEDSTKLEKRLLVLPMLANKFEDKKHYIQSPFMIQPKLDGVRMLVGKHDGKLVMISRTGKPIKHMEHISNEVSDLLDEGTFLDGENYSDDKTFEEITGLCRTSLDSSAKSKDLTGIKFFVFDIFNLKRLDEPFKKRLSRLENFFESRKFKNIFKVPTKRLSRLENVFTEHQKYVQEGYEGIMVRDEEGKYALAERSNHLLKYKAFQTEEYRIVGAEEASGKDSETVIWVCETDSGKKFSVRPRGTYQQRHDWFMSKHRWTQGDKLLTVQFQNLSPDGIPRFPVGLTIRDYE